MDETELTTRSVAVVTGVVQRVVTASDDPNGAIWTYVSVAPDGIVAGDPPAGTLVLREPGGEVSGRTERIFGAPRYDIGERVLVFLAQAADGSLRTTGMAMGKYHLDRDPEGRVFASRNFAPDVAVLRRHSGRLVAGPTQDQVALEDLVARVRSANPAPPRAPFAAAPPQLDDAPREYVAAYTLLAQPARWFEPDDLQSVPFAIDATGDRKVGSDATRASIDSAFAAWSTIGTTTLTLVDSGMIQPMTFSGCAGGNRIVFNDPYEEITDPTNCGGILAIGGYCTQSETRTVGGTTFRRIVVGKVTFNDGWEQCAGWNACNLAEVAVHEIGHAIGLGHSADPQATMFGTAHFDGRCAGLRWDDVAGAQFLYPRADIAMLMSPTPTATATVFIAPTRTPTPGRTSTPTRTVTPAPTRTRTPTIAPTSTRIPTKTPTVARTPTRTPTRTWTPTRTRTRTPTPTLARTKTPTPTAVRTRTPTATRSRTRTGTPTRTRTSTATRTRTSTPTATRSRTRTPTRTPTVAAALVCDGLGSGFSPGWIESLVAAWQSFANRR